ncbi:hypothetical protein OF83DRAFT_1168929 [Amylostereum chailletii]|nr:hypothetical protein OF83DRAFT_1168929 [Amylostereum chailletii]
MSLQGLMSGAECAIDANPLSQVLKHTDGDRSLQQDRIAGPSSSRLHHLPSSSAQAAAEQDMAMARQFFDGNPQVPSIAPNMVMNEAVARQLQLMTAARNQAPDFSQAWAEIQRQENTQTAARSGMPPMAWAGEFDASHAIIPAIPNQPHQQQAMQSPVLQNQMSPYGNSSFMYGGMNSFPQNYMQGLGSPPSLALDKGKGKLKEADFDAAFAQIDASLQPAQAIAHKPEVADEAQELTDNLSSATLNDTDQTSTFKDVWDQMRNSDMPPPQDEMAKWEAEFNQLMRSQDENLDYGSGMQQAWENGLGDLGDTFGDTVKFDHEGIPLLDPYSFESNNKYLDHSSSTTSPLDEAKRLLENNGSLTDAALLLEAAIQKGHLGEGGYEAWILLGETRNMDEREEAGMKALTEGVRIATEAGAAGAGMLSLAISYTNESFDRASHAMLLRWLGAHHPEYPISPHATESLSQSQWHSHEMVTDAFLTVARAQHAQGIIDPDVQIALGVLFYTNGNFDRAKDCFETALAERPNDYLLWNRLGSSLSNGNKPEESLGAYRQALGLRPTYTRAIYNVGVACLNIGAHKEAAEHFLSALVMQESTGGDKSEQLLSTLRRAFIAMRRTDLSEQTTANVNLEVFRKEGFEF